MKEYKTVSIVIPMYNVEPYIRPCLESVIEQTYDDIEIVLVDDGATDNSHSIAADILSKSKIDHHIVQQKNMGVSAARNIGASIATGKWIVFLDADDVIHRNFIKYLVDSVISQNIECVAFSGYSVVDAESACRFDEAQIKAASKITSFNRKEIQKLFLLRKIRIILPAMIVSKELLIKNNIKFDEDCQYSEDIQFLWMILGCIDKVLYIDKPIYNYVFRCNSTMTSSSVNKILTGYLGMNKLYNSSIINGRYHTLIRRQIKARWVFGALHSGAKMLTYQDYLTTAEKMNFNSICKKLMCFGDIRTTLLCIAWRLSKQMCYKIMRRY